MKAPLTAVAFPNPGSILAHQGGWDEIILVMGPLAVIAGALWLANRRVSTQLEESSHHEAPDDDQASSHQQTIGGGATADRHQGD
jgi:hypothetical protein